MLSPFDDFPIHPSADPIAHVASGDANHYDRYWFNGHQIEGDFYFGAAMGHYPVRGVVDAAFSVVIDGIQHSVFASGRMPLDRSTVIGPIRIEVREPLRTIRVVVEANDHGMTADLIYRASTVAVEEPRQRRLAEDGVLVMDHSRLTQWGTWEGTIEIDGRVLRIDPGLVPGTRDRSWGVRPVGPQVVTNRPGRAPHAFWMWAPLHFGDRFTHLALHENVDGSRWLESALVLNRLADEHAPVTGTLDVCECRNIGYELTLAKGTRLAEQATLYFTHPEEGDVHVELERIFTFRMRGIGYFHPYWGHGSNHGDLETGRESIALDDFDNEQLDTMHVQNLMRARMGDRLGIGVLEQVAIGPHEPTDLTGLFDGWKGS